jgi:hypothetical protein
MVVSKPEVATLRQWILTGEPPAVTPELAAVAVEQGLAGLLLAGLGTRPGLVGSGELDRLRDAMRGSLARGLRLVHLAGRAQGLLSARGLRSLPLKGAALAESLYDSVGFRPMLDADLLVLDAWPDAVEALLVEGYRAAARSDHASVFVCPVSAGILELHRSVTSCPGLFPMDTSGLWSRSLPADGPVSRLPSTEDLLVHLCLHASFQHGLVLSLVQWLDFRLLLSLRAVNIDRVIAIASEARAVAAVGLALRTAAVVVGAPVPEALEAALPLPPRLRSWLERREGSPHAFIAPAAPALARLRYELAAGRRRALVALTLGHGAFGPRLRMGATGARALHLARRWALPSLRSWRGAAS